MFYKVKNENGEINKGNYSNIAKVFEKAKKGEAIKVAFLGGSITQGCLSSVPETCYSYLVYDWFVKTFKESKIEYINAGIGGTTSQYGVARVKEHVLSKEPDFLLIEFAVNDENNIFFRETYEGLVRKAIYSDNAPAVLLMNNVRYDDGTNAEDMHIQIAKHYDIPMVSMKSTILPEVKGGQIKNREITEDDLHPNDAGHALVANVIIYELEKILKSYESGETVPSDGILAKEPLTLNGYENSSMYTALNSKPVLNGFKADSSEKEYFLDIYKNGWTADKTGDSISFEIEGTGVAIQYRKSVNKPAPIAEVVVDGDLSTKKMLNANFDEDWGDCLYIETVTSHMNPGKHKVEITITEAHEDDKVPFYLVSVIGS